MRQIRILYISANRCLHDTQTIRAPTGAAIVRPIVPSASAIVGTLRLILLLFTYTECKIVAEYGYHNCRKIGPRGLTWPMDHLKACNVRKEK